MDKENNAMHVNPNKNDAWKDRLIKKLKIENFSIPIGRASIGHQSNQAESFGLKYEHFRSVEGNLQSVK